MQIKAEYNQPLEMKPAKKSQCWLLWTLYLHGLHIISASPTTCCRSSCTVLRIKIVSF